MTQRQFQQLKLALDVHAASLVVMRMADGAKPQPPQRFKPADFLEWAKKQAALAKEVVSCYEAGPTDFWLHRQLTALGIRNDVVCPTCLDERRAGVNNDRTDALELATRLDRYLAGNDRALAVVRAAGRDVSIPDGHTVGKTFYRRVLLPSSQRQELARSRPAANPTTASPADPQRIDTAPSWWHPIPCLQNGARETGLGDGLPGFLRPKVEG